jgi:hypothetical protein
VLPVRAVPSWVRCANGSSTDQQVVHRGDSLLCPPQAREPLPVQRVDQPLLPAEQGVEDLGRRADVGGDPAHRQGCGALRDQQIYGAVEDRGAHGFLTGALGVLAERAHEQQCYPWVTLLPPPGRADHGRGVVTRPPLRFDRGFALRP